MLVVGALYTDPSRFDAAMAMLAERFGPAIHVSPAVAWGKDYYTGELGLGILRRFLFFERLIIKDQLADIKMNTAAIEDELRVDGGRTVNLDPGYLDEARLVLASKKDYSHRIYIGKGVFAETTLVRVNGTFKGHMFTYEDYLRPEHISLFEAMRLEFRRLLDLE